MPPRKSTRPRRKAQKGRNRKTKNVSEWASLSCARTFTLPGSVQPSANNLYSLMNTSLSDFTRAVNVAQSFQFYRIKNVTMKIKPQFDTYAYGIAGYGKPKLYYMLDKSGTLPSNVTLEALKQMGARPRNLDENAVVISWSPSILTSAMTAPGAAPTTQPAEYKISPWITTSANTVSPGVFVPNSVDHLGVYWYVESTSYGGTGGLFYQIDVEVQFEFKKALQASVGATHAIAIVPAVLDASPDGIEGGSDGISIPLH